MANHDPNHSSTERTILWIILPATVAVSLLFTNLNHKMKRPNEKLSADMGVVKKEMAAPAHEDHGADTTHTVAADTSHVSAAHADTTHAAPHAPAAHH
jgi:hypothetical protein